MISDYITLSESIHTLSDAHTQYSTPLQNLCDNFLDMDSSGSLPWSPWVDFTTPTLGMSTGVREKGNTERYHVGVYRVTHVDDISFENGIANRVAYYGEGRMANRVHAVRNTYKKRVADSIKYSRATKGPSAWHPCGQHMADNDPSIENWYYSVFDISSYGADTIVMKDIARVLEHKLVHRDLPRFNTTGQTHDR